LKIDHNLDIKWETIHPLLYQAMQHTAHLAEPVTAAFPVSVQLAMLPVDFPGWWMAAPHAILLNTVRLLAYEVMYSHAKQGFVVHNFSDG
jgi:hypothetical protein